jgi:hypothetical protein
VNQAPPKLVLLIAVLVLGLAAWFLLRTYTNGATRECEALYRGARTAADTARVDTTVTPGSRRQTDPRSCGFLRTSARWQ